MKALRTALDVATRSTADFLARHLSPGASLLEVGCGEGDVALDLLERGYSVTGIDTDEIAIGKARSKGLPAIHADWLQYASPEADAIAFTRSLHHVERLQEAIAKSSEALRPNGVLLIEDFAYDMVDGVTIDWFVGILKSANSRKVIDPAADEFIAELLGSDDPGAKWRQNHDHELHSIETMAQAIAHSFSVREAFSVPYLYRYLIPATSDGTGGATIVELVRREEERLGIRGEITLIGRRIVATPRPGDGN